MTKDKALEAIKKLPQEFELDVLIEKLRSIEKVSDEQEKEGEWQDLIESVDGFTQDFMENREQPKEQIREAFDR